MTDTALTTIEEYGETAKALAELRHKYDAVVFDVTTGKGMAEAKAARAELRTLRVALEARRKEIKAPALKRCGEIDTEAKRITAELSAMEDPIDETIKAEEQRKEREKAAREQAEREAQAALVLKFDAIKSLPLRAVNATVEQIDAVIAEAEAVDLTTFPENMRDAARFQQSIAVASLKAARDARVAHDSEQVRIVQERAELEALRKEQAERQAAQEREAAAQREREAEEQRQRDAAARAEREAAEAQAKAAREAQEAADREARRIEQERIAAEREALRKEQEAEEKRQQEAAEKSRMALSEISGIQQQVMIATAGRKGVRTGGTIECIRETLAETEAWEIEADRFGDFAENAKQAKASAVASIRQLLADAEARNAAAETALLEQEAAAAERKRLDDEAAAQRRAETLAADEARAKEAKAAARKAAKLAAEQKAGPVLLLACKAAKRRLELCPMDDATMAIIMQCEAAIAEAEPK